MRTESRDEFGNDDQHKQHMLSIFRSSISSCCIFLGSLHFLCQSVWISVSSISSSSPPHPHLPQTEIWRQSICSAIIVSPPHYFCVWKCDSKPPTHKHLLNIFLHIFNPYLLFTRPNRFGFLIKTLEMVVLMSEKELVIYLLPRIICFPQKLDRTAR